MAGEERIQTKAVVIGAGPGGYVAAIRLGQLGVPTVLVDRDRLGGVCLNVGCIPSKALIHASKLVAEIQTAAALGINVGRLGVDLAKMVAWKDGIVERLTGGIGMLLKKRGVQVLKGQASFKGPRELEVLGEGGAATAVAFESAILATGGRPIELPGLEFDGEKVISSTEALSLSKLPKSIVVIGGGAIGLEIGTVFLKLGAELTVIELLDQLLPGTDAELVEVVAREFKKKKAKIHTRSKVVKLDRSKRGVAIDAEGPHGPFQVEADVALVTVGRKPNSAGLGLDAAGVATDAKGHVPVNEKMETSVRGIYAIGDVTGPPLLAHRASKQGIVAAERIAGRPSTADWKAMPAATFTDPEIATVGLSEAEARSKFGDGVKVGRFPYPASGRAQSAAATAGFVKLVAGNGGLLVGAGIVGANASELVAEMALAIEMGATLEDVALTVHAHPTFAEMTMEAAEAALGHAIHLP